MLARILGNVTANHPWLCVLFVALLTGAAMERLVDFDHGTFKLGVDPSIDGLLPNSGPELEIFERTRERFGGDDLLLVAWLSDDLFSPARLSGLKRFTARVEHMPGVIRVDSLASALHIRSSDGVTDIDAFLSKVPKNLTEAHHERDQALANPLYVGRLVSPDARGVLVSVQFDPGLSGVQVSERVEQIIRASREEAGDITNFVSGPVYARLELSRALFRDLQRVLPLAVLGTMLIAALGLRTMRGVVLPLASNLIALSWTLALFVEAGHALNLVTVIIPPVVFVVGFAYAVHVVSSFDREFAGGCEKREAIKTALSEVLVPLTLTALTTAVGFGSLAVSNIESIHLFGIYAALGTVLAWVSALLVVPSGLRLIPARAARAVPRGGLFENAAAALARFALSNRQALLVAAAVLAVCSVLCASRLEVNTDYLRNFPVDNPVRRDFDRLGKIFTGVVPLQILIESDIPEAFKDPVQLSTIKELEQWLVAQPEVGGVVSLVDYLGVLYRALAPDAGGGGSIPPSKDLTDQLLLLGGGENVARFADPRYRSTLLHVRSTAVSTRELTDLITRIETRLAELPGHLDGKVTGTSVLIARTIDDITRGQIQSLIGAALVIYLVLVALFGSPRVGALALLPNLLPILAYFGILGLSGINLSITTSMVASVALGIAVDDTIHFLSRLNTEARRVADEAQGVERALNIVIRPVTLTTAGLCMGFLALTMGELRNQIEFGSLAALTLLIAWVLDLTFTPALSGRLRFVTLWEALTVDLGCAAPEKTIPLFRGLTGAQARTAALMGTTESFDGGERIVRLGEPGNEIRVVINGELVASVPRADGDHVLRTLRRGDLVGEVGLFHGTASANVDATSPVTVLRLQESCLRRIQNRYPKIGAQLFRNLGESLANRLADITDRL